MKRSKMPAKQRAKMTIEERFWRNVTLRGPDDCWPYGSNSRYGNVRVGGAGSRHILAHRLSYLLAFGHLPDKLVVMHKCDNPRCVNPKHLCLGTCADNIKDAVEKGRMRGQFKPGPDEKRRNGNAKLTASQVEEIRNDRRTSVDVAKEYGLHPTTIQKIRNKVLRPNV